MSPVQKAIIRKDIREVCSVVQLWLPMLIVPFIFAFCLPLILLLSTQFADGGLENFRELLADLPPEVAAVNERQRIFYFGVKQIFPALFLLIPMMAASILGASSLVGEKEKQTMETLLYTPIAVRELFFAKLIGTFLPAYAVTLLAFLLFSSVCILGQFLAFGSVLFPLSQWLLLVFWLCPAVSGFGLGLTVIISAKARTFQEAQQLTGLVVLPFVLAVIGQFAGVVSLGPQVVTIAGAALYLLAYLFIRYSAKNFTPEKLI